MYSSPHHAEPTTPNVKGNPMANQIVCPHCNKTITNNAIIDDAEAGKGMDTRSILCDCGERITYWQITAQLRDQRTIGRRFQKWVRAFSNSRS
jgi:hypothetical protein